ncbi:MAG TPA: hypothetical protein VGK30_06915 [Candidatus Binatia bacterium]|jgi:hypothetical protein
MNGERCHSVTHVDRARLSAPWRFAHACEPRKVPNEPPSADLLAWFWLIRTLAYDNVTERPGVT